MTETVAIVVAVAVAVVGAAVAVLKVIAPKTATPKDDRALEILEGVQDIVEDVADGKDEA
jgi:hypothetical protein